MESLQIKLWLFKLIINKLYNSQERREIDKLENKFEGYNSKQSTERYLDGLHKKKMRKHEDQLEDIQLMPLKRKKKQRNLEN